MKDERLFNLFGLAKELHLPVGWLKDEALAGRIPCLKIGRRLRFNKKAVQNALAQLAGEGNFEQRPTRQTPDSAKTVTQLSAAGGTR